jgi:hypothetical protein
LFAPPVPSTMRGYLQQRLGSGPRAQDVAWVGTRALPCNAGVEALARMGNQEPGTKLWERIIKMMESAADQAG